MPLRRILPLVFAAGAALPVLAALVGLSGWVPATAGVVALLAAALHAGLLVRRPVTRWALTAGIVVLAAASVVSRHATGPLRAASVNDWGRHFHQVRDWEHATAVLLAVAAAALTVGTATLPQFRRPAWQTAVACLVALVPVMLVAEDVAAERAALAPFVGWPVVALHFGPGLLATGLAGLAVVLTVSRADRWLLVPAGTLLLQLTAAYWTWNMSTSWYLAESLRGVEVSGVFLNPGVRIDRSTAGVSLDFEIGAALATAVLFLGPALIAMGAARTASAAATAYRPAEPSPEAVAEPADPDDGPGSSPEV